MKSVAAALVLLAIGGCADRPAAKEPATPAPASNIGSVTLKAKDGSVSITMPPGWFPATTDDPGYRDVAAKFGQANPRLKDLLNQAKNAVIVGIWGNPTQVKTGYFDAVTVTVGPSGGQTAFGPADAVSLKEALRKKTIVVGSVDAGTMDLPGGPALYYSATVQMNVAAKKPVKSSLFGYAVIHGKSVYIVTFTTTPSRAMGMRRIAKNAMATLVFGG